MTNQEMFDMAVRGLASQNFEKSDSDRGCLYRGPEGRRCALGWCIPDDLYDPAWELCAPITAAELTGAPYDKQFQGGHAMVNALGIDNPSFARDLQRVHDRSAHPRDMRDRLRTFATEYSLTIPDGLL